MPSSSSTRALASALLRSSLAGRETDLGLRLVQLGGPAAAPLRDGLTLGRGHGAGLRLRSREVSREHARVVGSSGGFSLEDRSKNGVRVNGRAVRGRVPLAAGDEVVLGGVRLRVADLDADPDPDLDPDLDLDLDLDADRDRDLRLPLAAAGVLLAAAALALAL